MSQKSTKGFANIALVVLLVLVVPVLAFIGFKSFNVQPGKSSQSIAVHSGKRVLYVDSYHKGYEWSDGITNGIVSTLEGTGVELKIHRMDTKRNTDEEFKEQAALETKAVIEEFEPDVLIVSDDNAFKYLVQPFYKDVDLPIVFSGLNWDASVYGAPYENTTGMVEVSLTLELIEKLKTYTSGDRVGYLTADVLTERKNAEYYEKLFDLKFDKLYFVTTLAEWKNTFSQLQNEVDIIIFENNAGIVDWDDDEAESFALENTEIPVGTTNPWTMQSSLIGLTKVPKEQGEWSAKAVLEILNGTPPSQIPVVQNKNGELFLNIKIANKLGVVFEPSEIRSAEIVR